jgi:hypothetical protein
MTRLLVPLACLLTLAPLRAGQDADALEIVRRARTMMDSTFKGDMNAVLTFMHPETVKRLGGEEALKTAIRSTAEQMKQIGVEFVSMDVRPPTRLFPRGERTFAVVKTTTVMQIPAKARFTEEGSMIAVCDTPGAEWTFVRVNAQLASDRTVLKRFFPDFPDELTLEPPMKPVVEPLNR